MAHFRRMYLAWAAAAMCSSVAGADALHGFCSDCGGTSPVGATAGGPLSDFGFWNAGKNNTGTYFIDILIPDNGGTSAPSGKYTISGDASGTATLFSSTAWTSGKIASYLGISASPSNPLSAWLHATQSLDPKAMGYWVFQANLGMNSLSSSSGTGPLLNLNSTLPQGSVIVAFLETSNNHGIGSSHEASASDDETSASDSDGKATSHGKGKDNDHENGKDNDHDGGKNNNHGEGKSNNVFTATANGGRLFEMAAGTSNDRPGSEPGGGGSSTPKTTPGVPEPGPAALLMTALLGFGMRLLREAPRRVTLPA